MGLVLEKRYVGCSQTSGLPRAKEPEPLPRVPSCCQLMRQRLPTAASAQSSRQEGEGIAGPTQHPPSLSPGPGTEPGMLRVPVFCLLPAKLAGHSLSIRAL